MSAGKCSYPEHHVKRDTGLLGAAVLVLVAWKFRHLIIELAIWSAVVVGLVLAVAAVVLAVRLVIHSRGNDVNNINVTITDDNNLHSRTFFASNHVWAGLSIAWAG